MEQLCEFKQHLEQSEKSSLTVEKYTRDALCLCIWLGNRPLNKGAMLEFKAALMERYAVSSVNSILSAVNQYLEFIGRGDCRVKTIREQRRIFRPAERELTRPEYGRLIRAAAKKPRLQLLMQTICATGIRVSEHRFITVEAARAGFAQVRLKGKNRIVLLPKKLCAALLRYAKERKISRGSIFITSRGRPLDRCTVWAEMKKLCAAAGVHRAKVFPHNLRHLFARTYYSLEKDIVRLADILGHSSINTTRIYTATSPEEHRQMLDRLTAMIHAKKPPRKGGFIINGQNP